MSETSPLEFDGTPILDRAAIRAVDAAAMEQFGIPGIVLMENAARGLAAHVHAMAMTRGCSRVVVVCGSGNNGGDGYAAARHLHNVGLDVVLVPVDEPRDGSDAAVNAAICTRMELPAAAVESLPELVSIPDGAVIVDAILGTGLDRPPIGRSGAAVAAVAGLAPDAATVVAADVPSGIDVDTGMPLGEAVRAAVTVTFAAAKPGLVRPEARPWVGRLVVVDIGVPRALLLSMQRG